MADDKPTAPLNADEKARLGEAYKTLMREAALRVVDGARDFGSFPDNKFQVKDIELIGKDFVAAGEGKSNKHVFQEIRDTTNLTPQDLKAIGLEMQQHAAEARQAGQGHIGIVDDFRSLGRDIQMKVTGHNATLEEENKRQRTIEAIDPVLMKKIQDTLDKGLAAHELPSREEVTAALSPSPPPHAGKQGSRQNGR